MAGGNHPPKGSSSSSSSHRKSRWESGHKPPPSSADKKPFSAAGAAAGNSKPPTPKPSSNPPNPKLNHPSPKPGPTPSPSHPKPPTDPTPPHPRPGPIPPRAPPPFPDGLGPPPPPAYGFHMLERRTIALADGSVRSYFALPPDYQDFTPPPPRPMLPHGLGFDRRFPPLGPMSPEFRDRGDPFMRDQNQDYWNSLRLDGHGGGPENPLKRKGGGDEEETQGNGGKDEFLRHRQNLLQFGNAGLNQNRYPVGEFQAGTSNPYPQDVREIGRGDELRASKYMRVGGGYENFHGNVGLKHNDVDQSALKKAFLHFVKLINENASQKKNYLENGKQAPLQCVACCRSSKEFPDMHDLILHTYNPDRADLLVDHLGLHKALCILMGWNYSKPPDNSKAYQSLSADEAEANQGDLIMWPPMVIIHNTVTGKFKEGRIEGLGNKAMDNILKDLGFASGKAKSVYGREGHLGITLVKFTSDMSGLQEAMRLAEFLLREKHGRLNWARVQTLTSGEDKENNPNLVKVDEKTGEKTRILYGYLGTVWDLDKVDFDTRKKITIESRREYKPS